MKRMALQRRVQLVTKLIVFIALSTLLHSCFKGGLSLQSITGSSGEVLVIMDDAQWKSDAGQVLQECLERDVPSLPGKEPMFDLSQVSHQSFQGALFNATRNIVDVEISDKYTRPKIQYGKDIWAQPQAYIKLQAPDEVSMMDLVLKNEENMQNYFKNAECDRYATYFTQYPNLRFIGVLDSMFNLQMNIPASLLQYRIRKDFFWMYNGRAEEQQNLFVFSVPYTGPDMMKADNLNALCDSVTKLQVPGPSDSSYLATEYRTKVSFEANTYRGKYCAEMRGLWCMHHDIMGGPFVRWARVDEKKGTLVVAEAFVYAPNKKKRNNIRQLEAILRTWAFKYELEQDAAKKAAEKTKEKK